MVGDGLKNVLVGLHDYLIAAGDGAEAVAVGHNIRAAALKEFGEVGIVYLAAGDHNAGAERELWLRLAGLDLLQRLAQVGEYQILGTCEADELDNVELIARDGRIRELAHIADLGDDAADLVVLLNGGAQLLLREVHAVHAPQRLDDLLLYLAAEVARVPRGFLQRHVDEAGEEFFLRDELAVVEILLHAVHRRAAFLTEQRVDEVIAALEGALKYALGVGT